MLPTAAFPRGEAMGRGQKSVNFNVSDLRNPRHIKVDTFSRPVWDLMVVFRNPPTTFASSPPVPQLNLGFVATDFFARAAETRFNGGTGARTRKTLPPCWCWSGPREVEKTRMPQRRCPGGATVARARKWLGNSRKIREINEHQYGRRFPLSTLMCRGSPYRASTFRVSFF